MKKFSNENFHGIIPGRDGTRNTKDPVPQSAGHFFTPQFPVEYSLLLLELPEVPSTIAYDSRKSNFLEYYNFLSKIKRSSYENFHGINE